MIGNRGIDTDPGWVNRKLQAMQRQIETLRSERRFLHLPTTSATANMTVDAVTGQVSRSTSSSRYKQDIADLDLDLVDILKMRPRTWRDKADVAKDPDRAPRYVGFVAEELHDAGLGLFVGYDVEGNPESVAYDRLTVALLIVVKFLHGRVVTLQERIKDLEDRGTALALRVGQLETAATDGAQQIVDLQSSVTDMEARLSALEAAATPPPEPTP